MDFLVSDPCSSYVLRRTAAAAASTTHPELPADVYGRCNRTIKSQQAIAFGVKANLGESCTCGVLRGSPSGGLRCWQSVEAAVKGLETDGWYAARHISQCESHDSSGTPGRCRMTRS